MNQQEFIELGHEVINHINNLDDDWGLGQIKIDTILKMIEVGKKYDLKFTFAKKVTAIDEISWNERTIVADNDYLFVFPNKNMDLSDFWKEVDNIKETPIIDGIQELLDLDPVQEVENILGQSYKDNDNIAFGAMMLIKEKNATLKKLLQGVDTYWGCSFEEAENVLKSLGMECEYEENFEYKTSEESIIEKFKIYIHKTLTVFAKIESYNKTSLNTLNIYFIVDIENIDYKEVSEMFQKVHCSREALEILNRKTGEWEKNNLVLCNLDGREGVKIYMSHVSKYLTSKPISKKPFLWLLNYIETKGDHIDSYIQSMEKLRQCKSFSRIVGWEV